MTDDDAGRFAGDCATGARDAGARPERRPVSPPVPEESATVATPAMESRASPAMESRASPAMESRASPAMESRASPAMESRASPANQSRASQAQYWLLAAMCLAGLLVLAVYLRPSGGLSSELPAPRGTPGVVDAASGAPSQGDALDIVFTDAGTEAGVSFMHTQGPTPTHLPDTLGSGAGFLDYDMDGDLDLFIVNGSVGRTAAEEPRSRLFRNYGNGTFADVTDFAGIGDRGWGMGCAFGDYDNDGDPDIYVTRFGRDALYRNNGDGTFNEVASAAGVAAGGLSTSAVFADVNLDGFLDLLVARYVEYDERNIPAVRSAVYDRDEPLAFLPHLHPPAPAAFFINNGDGTFIDASASSGINVSPGRTLSLAAFDFDNDADTDIYMVHDLGKNVLLRNLGEGAFGDIGLLAGVDDPRGGMGVACGDYDNDGDTDISTTNWQDETNVLFRNLLADVPASNYYPGSFEDMTAFAGLSAPSLGMAGWGGGFLDFDNDGNLDLFVANGATSPARPGDAACAGQTCQLFRNRGDSVFQDWSQRSGLGRMEPQAYRGAAFGDYDNDGDMDVLVTANNGRAILLRNDGGNRNHWIKLRIRGTVSNRDSFGARVEILSLRGIQIREVSAGSSYLSQHSAEVAFGLGADSMVERIRIGWPSGITHILERVPADQTLVITEPRL